MLAAVQNQALPGFLTEHWTEMHITGGKVTRESLQLHVQGDALLMGRERLGGKDT